MVVKNRRTQNPYKSYFNYIFDTLIKLLKDLKKWINKSFFVTVSQLFLQVLGHILPKRHLLAQNQ